MYFMGIKQNEKFFSRYVLVQHFKPISKQPKQPNQTDLFQIKPKIFFKNNIKTRVSTKQTNKILVRTKTNQKLLCFNWFLVCLAKPNIKFFGSFLNPYLNNQKNQKKQISFNTNWKKTNKTQVFRGKMFSYWTQLCFILHFS
jgi:hypothetical protein